ncbi:MAG: NAD(P)H-hydrate dehydratase [Xanthomonadales bacterium]|nr:NAD(P)H-hydrate dehydratase [Xanthomonadales bacterium]
MNPLLTALYSVAAVRAIEARAVQDSAIDLWTLMRRAGQVAFRALRARWPEATRIVIVCGSGNNGGDGYVVAELARSLGLQVALVQVGAAPACEPAQRAVNAWHASGGEVLAYTGGSLPEADLVVDALFGIGLDRAPEGMAAAAIAAINTQSAPVFALDVPSGLDADRGHAPGACVHAAATLAFVAWKRGLWTGVAARVCGERQLATLEVPAGAFAGTDADAELLGLPRLRTALAPRARDLHKGGCGHVLVIGGDHGHGGAALLAARAAAHSGAGLVSVATRAEHVAPILASIPEAMVRAVASSAELRGLIDRADVIALGPGLGQSDWGLQMAAEACASALPMVLDADALNLLAAARIQLPTDCVLTPHPGEAARLLGVEVGAIAQDRYAAVRELARRFRAIVVLKGAGSLVADRDGAVAVCPFGNPGMASGGMGDALTGIIAALIAQGLGLVDAARVGVTVHALAGDRAAGNGERGLLATDLIAELRMLVNP